MAKPNTDNVLRPVGLVVATISAITAGIWLGSDAAPPTDIGRLRIGGMLALVTCGVPLIPHALLAHGLSLRGILRGLITVVVFFGCGGAIVWLADALTSFAKDVPGGALPLATVGAVCIGGQLARCILGEFD